MEAGSLTCTVPPVTSCFSERRRTSSKRYSLSIPPADGTSAVQVQHLRTPSCCVGPGRCEWSNYDTLDLVYNLTQEFQDELHRPTFSYKFKIKAAGCACDCVASIARADFSIIGTWKGDISIDQKEVQNYAKKGMNICRRIVEHVSDTVHEL